MVSTVPNPGDVEHDIFEFGLILSRAGGFTWGVIPAVLSADFYDRHAHTLIYQGTYQHSFDG